MLFLFHLLATWVTVNIKLFFVSNYHKYFLFPLYRRAALFVLLRYVVKN
jgi:hypothetical protein